MSSGVCLIERSRGGDRIDGALLATGLDVSRWSAPPAPAGDALDADPVDAPRRLAKWISGQFGKGDRLGMIVLDAEGSLCGWLRAPSADPRVVQAMVRGMSDAHAGAASATLTLGPDHDVTGSAELQTLVPPDVEGSPERLALLSVPDAPARVLIDELDRVGQGGAAVISLWHALGEAWDPAADRRRTQSEEEDDRFVGESEPMTAVVAVDPRGRLLWSWSDGGKLVAAGALRLSVERTPDAPPSHETGLARYDGEDEAVSEPGADAPVVRDSDISRLAADWLGWSSQLGVSPGRIVAVVPGLAPSEGALSGSAFGAGLGRAWPGAPVDLAVHDDPMQATLDQLLRRRTDPARTDGREALGALSARPGRDHRALYRWSAAALLVAGGAMGVWAFRVSASAGETLDMARTARADWMQRLKTEHPLADVPGSEIEGLNAILASARLAGEGTDAFEPAPPILRELDEISWVIGNEYFEVEEISLSRLRPTVRVVVENIGIYEELSNALASIDSMIEWTGRSQERSDGRIGATFTGRWGEDALSGKAGGAR